jgi:hypothetical protein
MVKDLIAASTAKTLEEYVADNITQLYDYFTWGTSWDLAKDIKEIQHFTTIHRRNILGLSINDDNLTFLALLLHAAERLRLVSAFSYLFVFLLRHGYDVGSRMKASAMFMINVKEADAFLDSFESIYDQLQASIDDEEDDEDLVLSTIINYYTTGILDCATSNINIPHSIKQKFEDKILNVQGSFLSRPIIRDILERKITPTNYETETDEIHKIIDGFLNRGSAKGARKNGFLLEAGTIYTLAIQKQKPTFTNVRAFCVNRYKYCTDVYNELARGTKVLISECELFGYMHSYGKMHNAKLVTAFKQLPVDIFEHKPNIIDWGCGQGMATMCLLEYLLHNSISVDVSSLLLIEPSVIALERASFHVEHFQPGLKAVTINKDFDALTINDFDDLKGNYHLHLFSNILDMDFFSLSALITIIKQRFVGRNYFLIVSPYVDKLRTDRIDLFVNSFTKEEGFKRIVKDINEGKGMWVDNWTRVQRMFCVDL